MRLSISLTFPLWLVLLTTGAAVEMEEYGARSPLREATPERERLIARVNAITIALNEKDPIARRKAINAIHQEDISAAAELRAKALLAPQKEIPLIQSVTISHFASPELEEAIVQRAQLINRWAEHVNATRDADTIQRQASWHTWQKNNQPALSAFREQMSKVGAENKKKPLAPPPPLRLLDKMNPELRDFFLRRHAEVISHVRHENIKRGFSEQLQIQPAPLIESAESAAVLSQ